MAPSFYSMQLAYVFLVKILSLKYAVFQGRWGTGHSRLKFEYMCNRVAQHAEGLIII